MSLKTCVSALASLLSLVLQTAAQATGAEPARCIEAAMQRLARSPVGAASMAVGAFRPREGWREMREWRDDSREARCAVHGRDIVLLLDWASSEPVPSCLVWGPASGAAPSTVLLTWKSPKGSTGFATSTVNLRSPTSLRRACA